MERYAYVSGYAADDIDTVQRVQEALKCDGYTITLDWTREVAWKPYRAYIPQNRHLAEKMRLAVGHASLFVMIGNSRSYGALIERGMAQAGPRPAHVVLIGCERQSIFDALSEVTVYDTVEEFEAAL